MSGPGPQPEDPGDGGLHPLITMTPTIGRFTWQECPHCRDGRSVFRAVVSVVGDDGVTAIGEFGACVHCTWTPCPPRPRDDRAGGDGGGAGG